MYKEATCNNTAWKNNIDDILILLC